MSIGLRTLVLNSQYMPLSVFPDLYTIPVEEAIDRYLKGKCNVVHWYHRPVLTPSRTDLKWPSIVVNHNNKSFEKEVRLKKSTLFYRDHCKCKFCGVDLTLSNMTFEHLIPRSKGGGHDWKNLVLACESCNHKKGDSMPVGQWKVDRAPRAPSFWDLIETRKKFPVYIDDPEWQQFLPGFASYIVRNKNIPYVKNEDSSI